MHNVGIKTKLIIAALILSVLPVLIVGQYSYTNFQRSIESKTGILSEQLSKQNSALLGAKMQEVEKASMLVKSNRDLQKLLATDDYKIPMKD